MEHNEQIESQEPKKTWIAPAATVEKVSEITQVTGGGSGDGVSCHS